MGNKEWLTCGLLYGVLFCWLVSLGCDYYRASMRHKEREAEFSKLLEAFRHSRESSTRTIHECLAALAMQKSLVLVQRNDGSWRLSALDTSSREEVRQWLERTRQQAEDAAQKEPDNE